MTTHADALVSALAGDEPRLDLACLAIASTLSDERVDAEGVLEELDTWGARVQSKASTVFEGVDTLERLLAGELDFAGQEQDFDAPENSFLPHVVQTRRGLPILLSTVYLEVARRAKLPLFGVGLPGRFVVGYESRPGSIIVVDPFSRAQPLTLDQIRQLCADAGAPFQLDFLRPVPVRFMCLRMLRNLVGSYRRRQRWAKARTTLDLWLALAPQDKSAWDAYAQVLAMQVHRAG
jgi:regulator of sirC expression with transglutaminase-like and TPR domain